MPNLTINQPRFRQLRFMPRAAISAGVRLVLLLVLILLPILIAPSSIVAQQILTETPFNTTSDSFFENHGVNFNFSLPGGTGNGSRVVGFGPSALGQNIGFNQGSFGVVPPFGGFDPNASLNTGFQVQNPNGGGFSLGLSLGKGSTRSNVTQAPSVVTQNGFGGSIFDGGVRPFVGAVIPVVGGANGQLVPKYSVVPTQDNAITRALASGQLNTSGPAPERVSRYEGPRNYSNESSSALHGDESVSAIKARLAQAKSAKAAKLNALIQQAKDYEDRGKYLDARNTYRAAIAEAKDRSQKKELREKLNAIRGK